MSRTVKPVGLGKTRAVSGTPTGTLLRLRSTSRVARSAVSAVSTGLGIAGIFHIQHRQTATPRRRLLSCSVSCQLVRTIAYGITPMALLADGDQPEDAEVLHPLRALDERTQVEAIGAGSRRRLDRELEPRDLA